VICESLDVHKPFESRYLRRTERPRSIMLLMNDKAKEVFNLLTGQLK